MEITRLPLGSFKTKPQARQFENDTVGLRDLAEVRTRWQLYSADAFADETLERPARGTRRQATNGTRTMAASQPTRSKQYARRVELAQCASGNESTANNRQN
jgi:hypothetical protein